MQAKVEKVTYVEDSKWEWPKGSGAFNYNFVVKLHGVEDKRYVFVSKDENNPKIKVGMEADFNIDDSRAIKVTVGGKNYEYPKIEVPKLAFGGGGSKYTLPTKEQELNKFLGVVTSYATNLVCHRTDTGKPRQGETSEEALAKAVVTIANGIYDELKNKIQ